MVTATVREWNGEEGWGVLDIQATGFRTLSPGQQVDLTWEAPGFKQDGYDYRAMSIVSRPA
ncbi:cold shock domain-containing protein [Streptomyces mirabilis]|uniref:cold shock domain-containing protein n=1 Tax=Streptomyces mirabilis TaxID=68239 RepID=UPI003321EA13